jgi:hypothetical protein
VGVNVPPIHQSWPLGPLFTPRGKFMLLKTGLSWVVWISMANYFCTACLCMYLFVP